MKIGILGTGAYATALATSSRHNNHDVMMWTKFIEERDYILKNKEAKTLPGFKIDENIAITNDLKECITDKDLIIIAIPAAFIDDLCLSLKNIVSGKEHFCIATKGIEQETGLFIHEILEKYIDTENIAVISGPSFAVDIVSKNPCGLTLASKTKETSKRVRLALSSDYMKLRETNDIIGTEICGSIKNVIALASGIIAGVGGNDSTRAMLLTEAIHDMKTIIDAFDGFPNTVLSYAGFGDLLLTCTSYKSRNYTYGFLLGSSKSKEELEEYRKNNTVEGFYTAKSIYKLLKNKKVNVPIIDLIYNISIQEENPKEIFNFLIKKV